MWGWGRLRELPQVNYHESSEEEDYEEGLNFNNISPTKAPLPTREASPVLLAHPTLNDNVDEELEEVVYKLGDIQQVEEEIEELAELLDQTDTKVGTAISKADKNIEVDSD